VSGAVSPGDAAFARTAEPVRATVFAGGVETEYYRSGSGSPVLLLLTPPGDPDRDRLIRLLSPRARVIAPRIPAAVEFSSWLRDFLDGIGMLPVHIIAAEALSAPALLFAAADPSRVEQVTLWKSARQPYEQNNDIIP
jgi:hypothetical protein